MLRISEIQREDNGTALQLEGWIAGEDVDVLRAELRRLVAAGRCLILDLDGVRFIDDQGIELLLASRDEVTRRGGSPYVRQLLGAYGLASASPV